VATDGPMALDAQLQLSSLPDAPRAWQARLQAQGPLAQLAADATLSSPPLPGHTSPRLQAQAQLRPCAAFPLSALTLQTESLDLASLLSTAPRTALRGEARLDMVDLNQPVALALTLHNDQPGRWDAGALPVQSLTLRAQSEGPLQGQASLQALNLGVLRLSLPGGPAQPAVIEGSARWQREAVGGQLALNLELNGLQPAALDQRLAAVRLSGPLALTLRGLPSPGVLQGEAATAAPWSGSLQTQLRGRLSATAPEVALTLDAEADAHHLQLRDARAQDGAAQAQLSGEVKRLGDTGWQWALDGGLQAFDPLRWWPGAPDSAWRRGPHRLNATLASRASLSDAALRQLPHAPLAAARALQGQTTLTLAPSQLAGVPVQGQLQLDSAAATPLLSDWQAAGNRLSLSGRPGAASADDRWELTLDMPQLGGLAPLIALAPGAATLAPRSGALSGHAQLQGRDGPWAWQGQASLSRLSGPGYQADKLTLQAQGGSSLDAPVSVDINGNGLQQGALLLRQLKLALSGSLRQHHLNLTLNSPARPPAWFEQVLGAHTGEGSALQAQVDGRWLPAPAATGAAASSWAGQWQARVTDLQGRASDGSGRPWLAAKDLQLAVSTDAQGQLLSAAAEPGRLLLPDAALAWTTARWEANAAGPLPRAELQARIEPFALAPLLARAQPELGWHGDLQLGGEIHVRSGDRFDADLVFQRLGGDLSVADDARDPASRITPLGLSDLRLGLAAHEGTWYFTQALAGKQLGEMAGVATVHTRADLAWPGAQSPLEGVLQMRVAQLGAWGTWVPPGWRLGGELQTAASLGGRFGAPEFTGRLTGRGLSARHVLLGLQFTDGNVDVVLQGAQARIEQFKLRGGEGSLSVQGEARMGEQPQAKLQLDADRFLLLGRVDRRLVTSGQASLTLTRDALNLDGQLRVDEGLIDFSRGDAPGLDDDVSIAASAAASAASADDNPPAAPRSARPTVINARLDLGQKLRVKGRGLDTTLRGDLKITNPGGKLAVQGAVRTERGTYAAYGQKLEIERGLLNFVGPVEDPRLDIFAVRPNLDVVVGVAVTGSAMNPRVRLSSEPEMSDTYKLSWLVLGREPDGLGQADTALLQRAAMALLAGEGEAPTDALLRNIGLTDFSLRQTASSTNSDVRETVVSLGKQLSRRWYVGYERSVNATTGTWQLIYRAAQRFTLRAQSGEDNALDLIWSWRWQ